MQASACRNKIHLADSMRNFPLFLSKIFELDQNVRFSTSSTTSIDSSCFSAFTFWVFANEFYCDIFWMQNTSFAVPGIDFGYPKKGIDVTKAKPKHDMIPTHHAPIHAGSPRSIVTSSSFMASKSTHRVNCSAPPIDKWMKLFESLWLTDISKNRTDSGSHSYQTK